MDFASVTHFARDRAQLSALSARATPQITYHSAVCQLQPESAPAILAIVSGEASWQPPSSRTGGPRGTPRVRRETVSNFETEVHGLPLDETEVQWCF